MKILQVVKGKLFVAVFAGVVLIGGATAAFAASPTGQHMIQSVTVAHQQSAAATPGAVGHENHSQGTPGAGNACPGLPEAQQLASAFSLSTDSAGDAVQALCALHQGTFKGTTPGGTAVASSRVLGYGEIEMLLTYAHYLAAHDTANAGGTLTSSNVGGYLAQALQGCGTTPLETCLKTNIPGFQPGTEHSGDPGTPTATPGQDQNGHGHGNGGGKPPTTPTPGGKPPTTPTPGGKPTSTPTPPPHP
jgi:hypothetical protein